MQIFLLFFQYFTDLGLLPVLFCLQRYHHLRIYAIIYAQ